MTAKNYLRQLELLEIRIKQRKQQLIALKEKAVSISANTEGERVQSSRSGDKLMNNVIAFLELEQKINDMMTAFEHKKDKIITEIQGLTNPLHVDLLYRRYVDLKRLEQIACDTGYSYEYIRHIHGSALEEFRKMYLSTQ